MIRTRSQLKIANRNTVPLRKQLTNQQSKAARQPDDRRLSTKLMTWNAHMPSNWSKDISTNCQLDAVIRTAQIPTVPRAANSQRWHQTKRLLVPYNFFRKMPSSVRRQWPKCRAFVMKPIHHSPTNWIIRTMPSTGDLDVPHPFPKKTFVI